MYIGFLRSGKNAVPHTGAFSGYMRKKEGL